MNKKSLMFRIFIYFIFVLEIYFNLKSFYLWNDESFTLHIISHNFSQIINLTSKDVHPFLYYFIAKVFTINVHNLFFKIFILRSVSFLPYLILLIIGDIYIKKLYSYKVSLSFMFFIITMPILVNNIYQIRMYGFSLLFTTIVFILFIYMYKYNNNIIISLFLSLFSLLGAYTHYYALISIFVTYAFFVILFLLKKINIKYIIFSIMLDIILYIPWLFVLYRQTLNVSNKFWTPNIKIKDVILMFLQVLSPLQNKIFYAISICVIILLLYIIFNNKLKDKSILIFGLLLPLVLILIGAFLSIIVNHSVILLRYLEPSLGILWFSLSVLLFNTSYLNFSRKILFILLVILGFISYLNNVISVNNYANDFNKTKSVYQKIGKNSLILYDDSVVMYSASSYLNNNFVLTKRNNDALYSEYFKVFNNIKEIKGTSLPNHNNKEIYFISNRNVNHNLNKNSEYRSKLSDKFFKKYKLKKMYNIYLPLDEGKSIVYKVILNK